MLLFFFFPHLILGVDDTSVHVSLLRLNYIP